MKSLDRFADPVYSILRLLAGLMFACWGAKLVLGMFGGTPPPVKPILIVAGWIELIGGLLIAVGLLTRLAAFICSGTMAVAYFMVHAPNGFFPLLTKGELSVFYCWLFLFVVFYGPGGWSIDALIGKRKSAATTT
jgi:putative oxidoreductase